MVAGRIIMRRFSAKRSLRTGRHWHQLKSLQAAVLVLLCCLTLSAKPLHHYVFFGMDREQIKDAKSFFETEAFEGAQIAYSWRQLEPAKDEYDFSLIREDLALMEPHGKKLWIQIQDVTFNPERKNVPKYLLNDPIYNGGAAQQYNDRVPDQQNPPPGGWMARRLDPAVQERLHKLLFALAKEFDGRIEGVNFDETSGGFSQNPALYPKGFSHAAYRDGIITNMKALKRAFAKSSRCSMRTSCPANGGLPMTRDICAPCIKLPVKTVSAWAVRIYFPTNPDRWAAAIH
jgi:hypothetical protein